MATAARKSRARRPDPKPRSTRPQARWAELKDKDPGKQYMYISTDVETQATYGGIGWEPVERREGECQPVAGCTVKEGENITMMGQCLVAIDKERWEDIQENGEYGDAGQAWADRRESQMQLKKNQKDALRGINGMLGGFGTVRPDTDRDDNEHYAETVEEF